MKNIKCGILLGLLFVLLVSETFAVEDTKGKTEKVDVAKGETEAKEQLDEVMEPNQGGGGGGGGGRCRYGCCGGYGYNGCRRCCRPPAEAEEAYDVDAHKGGYGGGHGGHGGGHGGHGGGGYGGGGHGGGGHGGYGGGRGGYGRHGGGHGGYGGGKGGYGGGGHGKGGGYGGGWGGGGGGFDEEQN